MSENVFYDFTIQSLVAVSAPIGTDPETLISEARELFIERINDGDAEVVFENIFDQENGDYSDDWEGYCRG